MKVLKIFNSTEQEEDWSNISSNANKDHLLQVEKTYSMVEDEAREAIIQNLRENLDNEPSLDKQNQREIFKNDNIQLKIDSASKVKIIQRGKGTVEKEIKPTLTHTQKATSTYTMCSGKLVKFKDTRLEAIQLT